MFFLLRALGHLSQGTRRCHRSLGTGPKAKKPSCSDNLKIRPLPAKDSRLRHPKHGLVQKFSHKPYASGHEGRNDCGFWRSRPSRPRGVKKGLSPLGIEGFGCVGVCGPLEAREHGDATHWVGDSVLFPGNHRLLLQPLKLRCSVIVRPPYQWQHDTPDFFPLSLLDSTAIWAVL